MALQSKTFATGDLKWASWSNAYVLELILTEESISAEDNSSLVSYRLQIRSGSQNRFANYVDSEISFQGSSVATGREYRYLDFNQTWTLLSGQTHIPHDDQGDGLLRFTAKISPDPGNQWAPPDMEITGNLALTPIPRASSIGCSDGDLGSAAAICVGRKLSQHRHSIYWEFGSASGYIGKDWKVASKEVLLEDTAISFVLPKDWYAQIPNSQSGVCRLTCRTYLNNRLVGQTQCSFTARAKYSDCCPVLQCKVWDSKAATVAITGNENTLIRYASTAKCSAQAEARLGATIQSVTVNGKSVSTTFSQAEATEYVFRAKDSRGFVTEKVVKPTLVSYIPVTAVVTIHRDDPTDNTPRVKITGNYYPGSFGAVQNTLSAGCTLPDGSYVNLKTTIQGNTYVAQGELPGLDYASSHTVVAQVKDRAHTIERQVTVPKGMPVFHWGEEDFTFQVPVNFAAGALGLYPVGSIYLSTVNQSPGTLFGGSWERIRDVFLLCAGTKYAPGATGGEATHTLTVKEMPTHSHNGAVKTNIEGHVAGSYSDVRMWGEENTQSLPLTDTVGGGAAHNNMPPYLAVYAWKRVA